MEDLLDLPAIDARALDSADVAQHIIEARATQPPAPLNPAPSKTAALAAIDVQAVALARFGDWKPQAAALVKKYTGVVFDVSTTKGMNEATAARAEVREPRYAAQRVSKASKSELARVSKAIGAEEQAIIDALAATEEAIDSQIRAEEDRKAAAKAERERINAERIAAHQSRLNAIRACVTKAQGISSDRIALGIDKVEAISVDRAAWEEFADDAVAARAETLEAMRAMFASTKAAEDTEAAAAEQRRQQAIVAQQQADEAKRLKDAADAIAAEQKKATDALAAERAEFERERAEFLAAQAKAAEPAPEADEPAQTNTEERGEQHVLKAEAETPDATDHDSPVNTSPSVGSMGAGQPADAGAAEVPARPIEEQLADCRIALADALELLEGWILTKCPKRYVDEHMNKVAELRKQGGI